MRAHHLSTQFLFRVTAPHSALHKHLHAMTLDQLRPGKFLRGPLFAAPVEDHFDKLNAQMEQRIADIEEQVCFRLVLFWNQTAAEVSNG